MFYTAQDWLWCLYFDERELGSDFNENAIDLAMSMVLNKMSDPPVTLKIVLCNDIVFCKGVVRSCGHQPLLESDFEEEVTVSKIESEGKMHCKTHSVIHHNYEPIIQSIFGQ